MKDAWIMFFVCLLITFLTSMALSLPGHIALVMASRRRNKDLDLSMEHAQLAGQAIGQDDGKYEYHMRRAVYYFDRSDDKKA